MGNSVSTESPGAVPTIPAIPTGVPASAGNAAASSSVSESKVSSTNSQGAFSMRTLCPVTNKEGVAGQPSGCPMSSSNQAKAATENQTSGTATQTASVEKPKAISSDGCPMSSNYKNPKMYNVYSQPIDPTNNMPASANQQPAPGQSVPLSTERVKSSIPKGGTDADTWLYPSPQMFWNALVRKNKQEEGEAEQMSNVIAIHNNMNELTWKQILHWESLHPIPEELEGTGRDPKLLRFTGRPRDSSPKSIFKSLFSSAPFDRHDWIVDRGGKEIRYVIDYYHDPEGVWKDRVPLQKEDDSSMKSIILDVRPALDSKEAFKDRLSMWWEGRESQEFESRVSHPREGPFFGLHHSKPKEDIFTTEKVEMYEQKWKEVHSSCKSVKDALKECQAKYYAEDHPILKDPADALEAPPCLKFAMDLQMCTSRVICPLDAKRLEILFAQEPVDNAAIIKVHNDIQSCLDKFKTDSYQILRK